MNKAKGYVSAITDVVLGLLLAIGPWTIFKTCSTAENIMKCYYSCRAVLIIGIILMVIGLIKLLFKKSQNTVTCISSAVIFALTILIPSWAIGGCANPAMACQKIAFPCIYAICVIGAVIQLILAWKYRGCKDE